MQRRTTKAVPIRRFDSEVGPALRFVFKHTGLKADLAGRLKAIANIVKNSGAIMQELFETRCQRGFEIARRLRFSEAVPQGIQNLDKHWDGSGRPEGIAGDAIPVYPLGLSGEDVTLETRIITVADFFDALTADRPYRKAISVEKSLEIMAGNAGLAIDPAVFEALKAELDAREEIDLRISSEES